MSQSENGCAALNASASLPLGDLMNCGPKRDDAVELCSDDDLGYQRSRTRFKVGAGLELDETYRMAHLPLVAPDHPRVIPTREGTAYEMGRHARVFSLGLPIPGEALFRSSAYRQLEKGLSDLPFAHKIAWRLLEQRREKLHATICNSLAIGDEPPTFDEGFRRELAGIGPVQVELRGLFSGNVNVGRLYLRVYPERRGGVNVLRYIQRMLGRNETDLYLVGIYNFIDDLNIVEASALGQAIVQWWDRPILRFEADHLWLLAAEDDLVLNGHVVEAIPLVEARTPPLATPRSN